jgi:hypothetical protein
MYTYHIGRVIEAEVGSRKRTRRMSIESLREPAPTVAVGLRVRKTIEAVQFWVFPPQTDRHGRPTDSLLVPKAQGDRRCVFQG